MFFDILETVESIPEPCEEGKRRILKAKDIKHSNANEIAEMGRRLMERFNFICEVQHIQWREGEPKVTIRGDKIEVYFRHRKGFNLSLGLITTAKSRGQLEAAKKEIERFLEK